MKKLNLIFLVPLFCLFFSCSRVNALSAPIKTGAVEDSVLNLANNTERDINAKGPLAWLNYFDNSPGFFMASDGQVAFPNYAAADTFIKNTLAHQISAINLKLTNIRIYVISSDDASIGADFHEDLTITFDKVLPYDGYVTALAHRTPNGWKYLNLHWSIKKGN